ncbi:MAG: alpha/beta fold hydrolase [Synechococcales bacterium]|nr:alpha/beta fold hydrolase [Synechococcales bacterium]
MTLIPASASLSSDPDLRWGRQRDWVWRGCTVRYTYLRCLDPGRMSATPILFIHGFGAAIGHWRNNLQAMSQHYPVYAIDLLGFGASQKGAASYGTAVWVEQVYEFWRSLIRQPVVLVGNSLGSVVCLGLAAKHPEMVRGITFINLPDFTATGMPEVLKTVAQPIGAIAKWIITFPPIFIPFFYWIRQPAVIQNWIGQAYYDRRAIDAELVTLLASPPWDRGAARALSAMVLSQRQLPPEYTAKGALPRLTIPMLLIWGKQDRMVPPSLAKKIVSFNPTIRWVELDQAGHCPHDECPDRINPLLLDWLSTCVPE